MVRGIVTLLTLTGLAMGQAMVQHAAAAAGGAAMAAGSKKVADGLEKVLGSAASAAATAADPEKPKQIAIVPLPIPPAGKRAKHSPFEPQVNRAGGNESAPVVGPNAGRIGLPSPSEVESRSAGEAMPSNSWTPRRASHQSQGSVPAFTPFVMNDAPVVGRGARRTAAAMMALPTVGDPGLSVVPMALLATPVLPPPPPPVFATAEKLVGILPGASYESIVASLGLPASKIEMMEDGQVLESLRIESRGSKIGTIRMVNGVVTSVEPVVQ